MRRYYLLTLLLSCLTLLGWAERIDSQVAQKIAQAVASSYPQTSLRSSAQPLSLVYAAAAGQEGYALRPTTTPTEADYYVFNVGTQQGFVIVAGDDRVYPVLGYADRDSFDPDKLPVNLRGMLAYYQKRLTMRLRITWKPSMPSARSGTDSAAGSPCAPLRMLFCWRPSNGTKIIRITITPHF